jgi:hypothetical protein
MTSIPPPVLFDFMNPNHAEVMTRQQAKRLADCPESCRKLFRTIYDGKANKSQSIKGQCLECMGFDKAAIPDCTAWNCPLYKHRPYQKRQKASKPLAGSVSGVQDAF